MIPIHASVFHNDPSIFTTLLPLNATGFALPPPLTLLTGGNQPPFAVLYALCLVNASVRKVAPLFNHILQR
ncbi:hypothetical protein HanIR_Chr04g0169751 [Helianthus annuus]|nr:hypothetical protein HanIR_Chr04g0169751 [Helianthus annuus]